MEIMILVLPTAVLLLAAGLLAAGRIGAILSGGGSLRRERSRRRAEEGFLARLAAARLELDRRSRLLEDFARRMSLSREELAQLNDMKGRVLAMVAHDIRNPLSAIGGFSQILNLRGGLSPDQQAMVGHIRKASAQIQSLLGDLTDLAIIEAGKLRLEMRPFDLGALLSDIAAAQGVIAAQKGVAFSAHDLPSGETIIADPSRLTRVLTNLIGNALKFTPPGGAVELSASTAAGKALLKVRDSGPGIHPSEQRRIFQKFYQARRGVDAKARSQGWGLGLAISEEIARAHGGAIGVDSAGLGKGSTFWVKLPLAPRGAAARAALSARAALAILLAAAAPALCQTLPLDDKARYESSLEARVEGVLLRVLGPNRSKVVVDATVDFTRIEKFDVRQAPGAGAARDPYLWESQPAEPASLLPGVPQEDRPRPQSAAASMPSYEKRFSYAPEYLKRLSVTVLLDRSVGQSQSEELRRIVSDLLELSPARGDSLTVVHTAFAPVWKTVWYSPETAGLVVKYLLLGLLSLLTLLVVAACLLRLSSGLDAVARSQTQQLSMEMKTAGEGAPGGPPALEAPKGAGELAAEASDEVVFKVGLHQVETLVEMVRGETPNNIALLASRLEPETRRRLLELLPAEIAAKVMAQFGRVRFVEPEALLNLKDEIERRLSGAVGGLKPLLELVEASEPARRRRILDDLAAADPALSRELRTRVFLLEDLALLGAEEWSRLIPLLRHEEWAAALSAGPSEAVDGLKAHMPEGARRVLEQMLTADGHSDDARHRAQEKLACAAQGLMRAGRIGDLATRKTKSTETPDVAGETAGEAS